MREALLLALALLVGTLASPAVALANMAPPWLPGDVVGEPRGGTRSVAIEREELARGRRSIATGEPARVTATYHVRNDGSAESLSLLFVATGMADRGKAPSTTVSLDWAPVPVVVSTIPIAWAGGALASVLIGALVGRWLGHRSRSSFWALIPSLLVGIAWAATVVITGGLVYLGLIPAEQEAWVYGYGE